MCLLSHFGCVQLFVTLWTARLLCPWNSPVKNTGVGYHALLQGIFLTQGSKPTSLMSPALASRFFLTSTTWEVPFSAILQHKTKRIKKKFLSGSEYPLSIWPTSDHLSYIWGKKNSFQISCLFWFIHPNWFCLCAYFWISQKGIYTMDSCVSSLPPLQCIVLDVHPCSCMNQ